MLLDDIGLPTSSDGNAFAAAFLSIARDRQSRAAQGRDTPPLIIDELGFPTDDGPSDFARAFDAVR